MNNMLKLRYIILAAPFILMACNGRPSAADGAYSNEDTIVNAEEIRADEIRADVLCDIEIGLDIDYSDSEIAPAGECLKYKASKSDGEFVVEPTAPYYNQYVSGKRFEIPLVQAYVEGAYIDANVYPKFYCYLQNTTDEAITVSSLDVEVESSSTDRLPYFRVATEASNSNCLVLSNESWFNYGGVTLEYAILKKGETFSNYKKKIHIPYFEEVYRINFKNDLIEMGYDYEAARAAAEDILGPYDANSDGQLNLYIPDDEVTEYAHLFYPFEVAMIDGVYIGIARIYGRLSFDNSDFTASFHGNLSLTYPNGFGDYVEDDDTYDVELRTEGRNYTLNLPYNVTISPGETKKIGVTMKCKKSSNHTLRLTAANSNGLAISSVPIRLHYLNPRHSSKINCIGGLED